MSPNNTKFGFYFVFKSLKISQNIFEFRGLSNIKDDSTPNSFEIASSKLSRFVSSYLSVKLMLPLLIQYAVLGNV